MQGRPTPAAASQQQRPGCAASAAQRRRRRSSTHCSAADPKQPRQQVEAAAEQPGERLGLLQQLGRTAAGVAAAAVLAVGAAAPPPAAAVLASPRASVPRSADVALRRSIPAFNADVADVQQRLEAVAFKLRIPQRKPWGSMADDVAAAAQLAAQPQRMLAGVLPPDAQQAETLVADIQRTLDRLARAIEVKDSDRTSVRVSNALELVANLELLQAPGLPYQLPRQVAAYPALAGRAVLELVVEKASGEAAFVDQNSSNGPQKRTTLQITLDGYSAPITAANLLANFQAGLYNNVTLDVTGVSVLAGSQPAGAAGAGGASDGADGADGASDGDAGPVAVRRGARGAPAALPLEILPAGDFEPQYRAALDVRSGELPVLPLSIYGAVAMAHVPDSEGGANGYVSSRQFFIYKFSKQQAGLAGLSFDEGEFGVCGYITKGLDAVGKLESGDRIVKATIVSGLDKLLT
ncbi:peptidyl-prolyl cis-trans cyclophilin-type [Micractinium conductrix]|uniref:Peptidyl-prolyl cis-trans cyclophilin-type n=1 Tax=Micractinium conductrix TaxID=554055 RepID=A0A2P6V4R3_9CHLO|nr:peptidyl-prolyl cis-trans cyclophilin-type [Micractinium conductrix]|eukprot:PSC69067.1 peptidyl-prolyl cis-trans cyclophilin-type [Micractinium conductrix]